MQMTYERKMSRLAWEATRISSRQKGCRHRALRRGVPQLRICHSSDPRPLSARKVDVAPDCVVRVSRQVLRGRHPERDSVAWLPRSLKPKWVPGCDGVHGKRERRT